MLDANILLGLLNLDKDTKLLLLILLSLRLLLSFFKKREFSSFTTLSLKGFTLIDF